MCDVDKVHQLSERNKTFISEWCRVFGLDSHTASYLIRNNYRTGDDMAKLELSDITRMDIDEIRKALLRVASLLYRHSRPSFDRELATSGVSIREINPSGSTYVKGQLKFSSRHDKNHPEVELKAKDVTVTSQNSQARLDEEKKKIKGEKQEDALQEKEEREIKKNKRAKQKDEEMNCQPLASDKQRNNDPQNEKTDKHETDEEEQMATGSDNVTSQSTDLKDGRKIMEEAVRNLEMELLKEKFKIEQEMSYLIGSDEVTSESLVEGRRLMKEAVRRLEEELLKDKLRMEEEMLGNGATSHEVNLAEGRRLMEEAVKRLEEELTREKMKLK